MSRSKKILIAVLVILAVILDVLSAVVFFSSNSEILKTTEKNVKLTDSDLNKLITHDFKDGDSLENSIKIIKSPNDDSTANIMITFNSQTQSKKYKIDDLKINISAKNDSKLESANCDDGKDSKNYSNFSDNSFSAESADYLWMSVNTSDYHENDIDISVSYSIKGRGIYSIIKSRQYDTSLKI